MPEKNFNAIGRLQREQYDKGSVAFQRQNFDYAISIYQQALVAEPGFYECRAALRAAQFKRAGGSTSFFKKIIGGASSQPMLTKVQLTLRKNPLDALTSLENVLSGDPYNMGAHKLMVEAADAADFPKTAILSAEILAKNTSKDRELMLKLAALLTRDGQIDKAQGVYEDMLKANPNDPEAAQLAKNLTARQTLDKGGYEKIADGSGSYRDILKNKSEAEALEQEGRTLKTEDVAANLIREYQARAVNEPQNLKLLRNLAELLTQQKDFDGAMKYYDQIRAIDGGADSSLEKVIADLTIRKLEHQRTQIDPNAEDYQEQSARLLAEKQVFQLSDAQRRMERYPNDLGIRFELGVLYFEAGKITEAIQELQKAQNNPQRRLPAMSYLGQCFAKRGMNDMAARKLQEALKEKLTFDAEKKELTYTLGCVLEKMGKKDEAIEQFKIIYEADIGYKDVAKRVDDYYSGQG